MQIKEYELRDCIDLVIDHRGKTPKKLGGDWTNSGRKVISAKHVKGGMLVNEEQIRFISEEIYLKWMKVEIQFGDVLIASEGATLGENMLWNSDEKVALGQRIYAIRSNPKVMYNKYFAIYVNTDYYQNQIFSKSTGTSVLGIKQTELLKTIVKLPPLRVQKFIGDLFYSLQEKINVNNSKIKLLDEIAQTLFKRWFIDFEFPNVEGNPYKSSGGKMVDSELGDIPEVFLIDVFDNLISETIGGDWGKDSSQGNYTREVSILRGADIPEIRIGKSGKVPNRFILEKNYRNKKLLINDTIIEISGGSPTQSTGRVSYINQEILDRYNDNLLCTNFCRALRPKIPQAGFFIFMYFNYLYNENLFFSYENGTTGIKNFDLNSFLQAHQIPMPPYELIKNFNTIIKKYYSYIQELGNENIKLEELRDTLLPKLLSGGIEIPEESVVD